MPKFIRIFDAIWEGKKVDFWDLGRGAGGRAGGCGTLEFGKYGQALRKSRARRAPCRRQGAADLKAQAPLPPAPKKRGLKIVILRSKRCPDGVLEGLFSDLGGSGAPWDGSWRPCGHSGGHLGVLGLILGGPWGP